jgi:hypothetical protein
MPNPTTIRTTAGFRSVVLYEQNASFYPIGTVTRRVITPYLTSGSAIISGSTATLAAGVTVSGSVGYYGALHSGSKVLTVNDPTPRVITHVGDDSPFALQVLPPTEAMSGELQVDKTNDIVDLMASSSKLVTVGETNLFHEATNLRGFENSLACIAYAAGLDADPDSANFGADLYDFRIFPKVKLFVRESGYSQEDNVRTYSFVPGFCTAYPWQVQYTVAVEGVTRSQVIRGDGYGKPTMVTFLGDGATLGFPFDSAQPAKTATKIATYDNNSLKVAGAGYQASLYGVSFAVAPVAGHVITVFYES